MTLVTEHPWHSRDALRGREPDYRSTPRTNDAGAGPGRPAPEDAVCACGCGRPFWPVAHGQTLRPGCALPARVRA